MPLVDVRVQGIRLIPQDSTNACWFASTLMMYGWLKSKGGDAIDPKSVPDIQDMHRANNALPWSVMQRYAAIMGLKAKPLMTPSIELLAQWLRAGPLWTDGIAIDWRGRIAGVGHVVVLAGLRSVRNSDLYEVYVYDPWPPYGGHEGWRPMSHLVGILRAGADPRRNVFFLSY